MTSALALLVLALGAALFPVAGLLLNVGAQLGASRWLEGPLSRTTFWLLNGIEISLMVPVAVLLARRTAPRQSGARRFLVLGLMTFGVISLVFVEGATLKSAVATAITMSFRWGLLFLAFLRLREVERRWMRVGIMSLSVLAGGLTAAAAMGLPGARQAIVRTEGGTFEANDAMQDYSIQRRLEDRSAAPGFFTLMPLGLWLLISELVPVARGRDRRWGYAAAAGIGVIVVALLVNFSRNTLMGFLVGVAVDAWFLARANPSARRWPRLIGGGVTILALGYVLLSGMFVDVAATWRDSLTRADRMQTIERRIEKNISMLQTLVSDIAPFGIGVPPPETPGDPHLLPLAWWTNGLCFAGCLTALVLGSWADLLRVLRSARGASGWGVTVAAGSLCGYLVHWQFLVASGGYMSDAFWLAFWFSLAEIQRLCAIRVRRTGAEDHGVGQCRPLTRDARIQARALAGRA